MSDTAFAGMDDLEILYQTYVVTFATAAALVRSGNRVQLAFLGRDVEHRDGWLRVASELALSDALREDGEIRSRRQVVRTVVERTALALCCDPAAVYAALDRRGS